MEELVLRPRICLITDLFFLLNDYGISNQAEVFEILFLSPYSTSLITVFQRYLQKELMDQ